MTKKLQKILYPPKKNSGPLDTRETVFVQGTLANMSQLPTNWDNTIQFLVNPCFDKDIPKDILQKIKPQIRKFLPNKLVRIQRIVDPSHPACGQRGLFAAKKLEPKSYVIDYIGRVQLDQNSSKESNYVLKFDHGLSIDSEKSGNEARFINDYRNTGKKPNVGFENHVDPITGEIRIGVWVLSKPIKKGEEILINYGKPFWNGHSDKEST